MCSTIRLLRADEIDVRVQKILEYDGGKYAVRVLLYKNARTDMDILDETFGMLNWQRIHFFKEGKNYCRVSIWDAEKQQWIAKEDVGTESNTEAEKGQASDAFKRACTNIGIGRELYTAPKNIGFYVTDKEIQKGKTLSLKIRLHVSNIDFNEKREITKLEIMDNNKVVRYTFPKATNNPQQTTKQTTPAADPIASAEPIKQEKQTLIIEMFDNAGTCAMFGQWMYNAFVSKGSDPNFDVEKLIRNCYNVDDAVVLKLRQVFDDYKSKQAKK